MARMLLQPATVVLFLAPLSVAGGKDPTFILSRLVAGGQNVALPAEKLPTITLLPSNRVAGFAGVNRYFGSYKTAENNRIEWTAPGMGSTMMAGAPDRMSLETQFLKALSSTTVMTVDGPLLRFESADKAFVVEFFISRSEKPPPPPLEDR